jgi:hypothetical protein
VLFEIETLCEVWEEELLAPCTSSKLYCLEPIGVGTPMVESLTSYISRLADAHSVLLRTLVTNEILPNLNRTHLYQEGRPVYDHLTTFWKRSTMLNGTCSTASNWVHTIEQLTLRNDLRFLTMLTFANVLSWRGLVRPTQAWCPLCYEEWRKSVHVNRAMRGNFSEFARQVQFHRRTVWEWAQGLQVPKLDALLHICSYFRTPPIYLLMGNFHGMAQIKKDIYGKKPLTEQPHRQFRRFEAEKLQDALEQVLRSEEHPPPSMREVAHRLNYDQSHLCKHFPDLCRAISVRYVAYQQRRRRLELL